MQPSVIEEERQYRQQLWQRLTEEGGPHGVTPRLLRLLGLYDGQAGIWVDKARTALLTGKGGVTMSLLHNGVSYPDDISEDTLLYHYPTTRRRGHDEGEIEATKTAGTLRLPVFVITRPTPKSDVRNVQLGWVVAWDDHSRIFLVSLGSEPSWETTSQPDDTPFLLTDKPRKNQKLVVARQGQQRFKFRVIERYGLECAVCDICLYELLEAAHICPKSAHGSDDSRNGLLLCPLHHKAWDVGLFAIDPDNLQIVSMDGEQTLSALHVTRSSLQHLKHKPHTTALEWRWSRRT